MSDVVSYRVFSLGALRLDPFDCKSKVDEHLRLIDKAEQEIKKRVFHLVRSWTAGIGLFVALALGLGLQSVWAILSVVPFMIAAVIVATKVKFVSEKLRHSARYQVLLDEISSRQEAVRGLIQGAQSAQKRLEITHGPGFLAVFSDVINHQNFPSKFTRENRVDWVALSVGGRGEEIDVFNYSELIIELKKTGMDARVEPSLAVEKAVAQNKHAAALAYARMLAFEQDDLTTEARKFVGLVGLNAWLGFQAIGRPVSWENKQHHEWDLAKDLLFAAFQGVDNKFSQALEEFSRLGDRRALPRKKVTA